MKITQNNPSKTLISFRAEKSDYSRLKILARAKGIKLSTIFRNAIRQAIEEFENEAEK